MLARVRVVQAKHLPACRLLAGFLRSVLRVLGARGIFGGRRLIRDALRRLAAWVSARRRAARRNSGSYLRITRIQRVRLALFKVA